jgi:hypothetical protein
LIGSFESRVPHDRLKCRDTREWAVVWLSAWACFGRNKTRRFDLSVRHQALPPAFYLVSIGSSVQQGICRWISVKPHVSLSSLCGKRASSKTATRAVTVYGQVTSPRVLIASKVRQVRVVSNA